jgi:hypothetical protein
MEHSAFRPPFSRSADGGRARAQHLTQRLGVPEEGRGSPAVHAPRKGIRSSFVSRERAPSPPHPHHRHEALVCRDECRIPLSLSFWRAIEPHLNPARGSIQRDRDLPGRVVVPRCFLRGCGWARGNQSHIIDLSLRSAGRTRIVPRCFLTPRAGRTKIPDYRPKSSLLYVVLLLPLCPLVAGACPERSEGW